MDHTALVGFVVSLLLLQYLAFGMMVGMARARCKVSAPATTGNPEFERYYRVQMNTLEQLIIVIPAMWFFAVMISGLYAAILGMVFFVGRILYARGYTQAAEKRSAGFGIGYLATIILVLGIAGKSLMVLIQSL